MTTQKNVSDLRQAAPALRRTASFLRPYLRPNRTLVAGGFAGLFGEVIFRLLEPWPLKFVIDGVIGQDAIDGGLTTQLWTLLLLSGLAVIIIAGMRALCSYFMTVCFALAGTRTMTAVRARVYAHVLRMSLRFHSTARSGDLINRLVGDIGKLRDVAVTAAMPLLGNVVTLVAMLVVMLVLDWRLGLVVIAVFPAFFLQTRRSSKKITSAARLQRKREGELAGAAGESFGAMKVVQSYSLENKLEESFAASNDKELTEGVKATRLSAGLERWTDVLVGVATGAVLLVGGYSVVNGHLTPGELVVFVQYLKGAFKPMRDLAKYTGRISKAAASGERILDLIETPHDIDDGDNAYPLDKPAGAVTFTNVSAAYRDKDGTVTKALNNVNVSVPAGASVGVVGRSGSGKSTLASLLLRLHDPVDGSISIDGHDLRDVSLASLRSHVAIVLQESVLFTGTLRDNIRLGDPEASDEAVEQAAIRANVHEFVQHLPDGYDTVVGERGETLSGGQRQRIAIARAMLRDVSVVILDEAMTGLDSENTATVRTALDRLCKNRTTFIISHSLGEVLDCDHVIVLERGDVVEQGSPDTLSYLPGSRLAARNAWRREQRTAAAHTVKEVPSAR